MTHRRLNAVFIARLTRHFVYAVATKHNAEVSLAMLKSIRSLHSCTTGGGDVTLGSL